MKKLLSMLSLALVAGAASASTIQIQSGAYSGVGSFASASEYLAAVDLAVASSVVNTIASYDNLAINIDSGALKSTIHFGVASAGAWDFRAGVDFGKGGALFLDGVALQTISTDMWWNSTYNDPAQYFGVSSNMAAGNHTLTIVGLENCCSGSHQVQFKSASSNSFTSFSNTDGLVAAVPEPETYAMLLAGLGLIGASVKRRKAKQA
jgi:hypothetical protein